MAVVRGHFVERRQWQLETDHPASQRELDGIADIIIELADLAGAGAAQQRDDLGDRFVEIDGGAFGIGH